MKPAILVACVLAILVPAAPAQESRPASRSGKVDVTAHPIPSRSEEVRYERVIAERFVIANPGGTLLLHVRCLPSFAPEWFVAVVERDGGAASVELLAAERNLWEVTVNGGRAADVKIERTTAGLSAATAASLHRVWVRTLAATRYLGKGAPGLDGETYDLVAFDAAAGELRDHVWSPAEDSLRGRLVALAGRLRAFVAAKGVDRAAIEQALRADAATLMARLDAAGDRPAASSPASRPAGR